MSTADRMSRMYGTVIRVPYTVPADIWSCDYRNRYTAGSQPYFAVLLRPFTAVIRVSVLEIISCEFYVQTTSLCGHITMWVGKFTWDIAMFAAVAGCGNRDVCTYWNHIIYFQIRYSLFFRHSMPFIGAHGFNGLIYHPKWLPK